MTTKITTTTTCTGLGVAVEKSIGYFFGRTRKIIVIIKEKKTLDAVYS
jgi:hypothetical protein